MNDRIENCAVCDEAIDMEADAGFVTTGRLVVHLRHLPNGGKPVGDVSHTETTSTQGTPT